MSEPTVYDKAFNSIMIRLVETGQAPHFTEIAADLGVSIFEMDGKHALRLKYHALLPVGRALTKLGRL